MPDSQITKHALAAAMKELMAEKPMSKINIGDIAERCNMNRKSFYYHFKDKYDLVNWIFYTEFVSKIQDNPPSNKWKVLESVCEYLYENKTFYCNALRVNAQNSFSDYFMEVMQPAILYHFENIFEDNEDKEFFSVYFADATRVAITRWLLEDVKFPPEKFIAFMKSAISGIALKVVKEIEQE